MGIYLLCSSFANRWSVSSSIDRRGSTQTSRRFLVVDIRSEEHTSELQSRENLVCRLLLEKKKRLRVRTWNTCTSWRAAAAGAGNASRPARRAPGGAHDRVCPPLRGRMRAVVREAAGRALI